MMKMFALTLKGYALEWFDDCIPKEISSFSGLTKAFRKLWNPSYEEEEQLKDHMMHLLCLRFVIK
jgi:hypothetical protein